jgi:hypothetical protein
MDQMCFECNSEDASLSAEVRTVLLCIGIVVVVGLIFVMHRLYQAHAARGEQRDAGVMHWVKPSFSAGGAAPLSIYGKICISHYQILTQFRKPSHHTARLDCAACGLTDDAFAYQQPCSLTSPFQPSSRVGSISCLFSPSICTHSLVSFEYYQTNGEI